jgi:hypothetical protein
MKIVINKDKRYAAMTAFRIYHMITREREDKLGSHNLEGLWLQWRIDHDLPLKKEQWELWFDAWEVWLHSLDIFHDGKYIGELALCGPPSPELNVLLEKKAA